MVLNLTAPDFHPQKGGERIQAKDPTYEALLAAVKEDAKNIEKKRKEIQERLEMASAAKEALERASSNHMKVSQRHY